MNSYSSEHVREHIVEAVKVSSQAEVAEELGITQSALSLIVAGKRGISEEIAAKFGFRRHTVFSSDLEQPYIAPEEQQHG